MENDAEVRKAIGLIKSPAKRETTLAFMLLTTLFILAWIMPVVLQGRLDLVSLSALFSILGASSLWWESNHNDSDVVLDFTRLTERGKFSIAGLIWLNLYGVLAAAGLAFGTALVLGRYHNIGITVLNTVVALIIMVAGLVFAYWQFLRKGFYLQTKVRSDVEYVKNLPPDPNTDQMLQARARILNASKLSRNALRSLGFILLVVGGCFVLLDELVKLHSG